MKKQELIPKLSNKISFHRFSKTSYFIHQKEYDHRIKITKDVYDLLKKIDGKKNLLILKKETGNIPTVDFIFNLLFEELGKYGIIESDFIQVKKKEKPDYLKLSFIVIPPKIISRITPYLKFLFRPKLMSIIIFICVFIIVLSIVNNYSFIKNQHIENKDWILFFILGFISVTFHEFGHVTATEFFGAKHGGIGGGFYLFSPVYYADVTDIWKLKPKQRIIVNIAGIYFELIICSLLVVLGVVLQKNILLVIGSLIFLKTLFNLNPFLRSDGYWILTDSLRIPNLYKVSSNHLGTILKSIFKNKKFNISKRIIFLALYASINYILLIFFVSYTIVFNSQSVLFLPYNIFIFFKSVSNDTETITLTGITQFIIPLLFYYLGFKLIKNLFQKREKIKK